MCKKKKALWYYKSPFQTPTPPNAKIEKKAIETISTSLYLWVDLYTFFIKWFVQGQCSSTQSMGPVSEPQWTEEAEGRRRRGPDQSVLSFPPSSQPPRWPAPRQSAQEETEKGWGVWGWRGCSHPSNESHHGRGSPPPSFVPCCQLSRLASAVSMGSDVMVVITHPSRPIPICVFVLGSGWGENRSVCFKRATYSVWSNKHSALLFCPL